MSTTDALNITTLDGKYTVVLSSEGYLRALRYGQPWRDCVGDGLILTLAQDIETLTKRLTDSPTAPSETPGEGEPRLITSLPKDEAKEQFLKNIGESPTPSPDIAAEAAKALWLAVWKELPKLQGDLKRMEDAIRRVVVEPMEARIKDLERDNELLCEPTNTDKDVMACHEMIRDQDKELTALRTQLSTLAADLEATGAVEALEASEGRCQFYRDCVSGETLEGQVTKSVEESCAAAHTALLALVNKWKST